MYAIVTNVRVENPDEARLLLPQARGSSLTCTRHRVWLLAGTGRWHRNISSRLRDEGPRR